MKVLHIQIARMRWKGYTHLLRVRIGDIEGSIECSNATKAEVMREVSDAVDGLYCDAKAGKPILRRGQVEAGVKSCISKAHNPNDHGAVGLKDYGKNCRKITVGDEPDKHGFTKKFWMESAIRLNKELDKLKEPKP